MDTLLGIMCLFNLLQIVDYYCCKISSETKLHSHFVHFTTLAMQATNDLWAKPFFFWVLGRGGGGGEEGVMHIMTLFIISTSCEACHPKPQETNH